MFHNVNGFALPNVFLMVLGYAFHHFPFDGGNALPLAGVSSVAIEVGQFNDGGDEPFIRRTRRRGGVARRQGDFLSEQEK